MNKRHKKNNFSIARKPRGFTVLEVILSFFILLLMALMAAAVIPVTLRATRSANTYELASAIAQKKLDQLMDPAIGFKNLQLANLQGTIVDATGTDSSACAFNDPAPSVTGSYTAATASYTGDYAVKAYFTKIDNLVSKMDDGTAPCSGVNSRNTIPGYNVHGQVDISAWPKNVTPVIMMQATVTITWQTTGSRAQTYTLTSLIPKSNIL